VVTKNLHPINSQISDCVLDFGVETVGYCGLFNCFCFYFSTPWWCFGREVGLDVEGDQNCERGNIPGCSLDTSVIICMLKKCLKTRNNSFQKNFFFSGCHNTA